MDRKHLTVLVVTLMDVALVLNLILVVRKSIPFVAKFTGVLTTRIIIQNVIPALTPLRRQTLLMLLKLSVVNPLSPSD